VTDADLTFCISETNRYGAMRGRPSETRSAALESNAADSARIDAQANKPHQHFTSANGGGVSIAENEFLNAAASSPLTNQAAIQTAISLLYREGPGGGHFENMMSYANPGCGIYRTVGIRRHPVDQPCWHVGQRNMSP